MKRMLMTTVILVVILAALSLGLYRFYANRPIQPSVARGVTLLGKDIGGLSEGELRNHLVSLEPSMLRPPVQPVVDTRTRGVIPGLGGHSLNVEQSLNAILSAPPQSVVELVMEEILPDPPIPTYPIFQGNSEKQQIALVVNVAWGNDELLEILQIFERENIRTTFFLVGRWAAAFPDLVQEIHKHGHELANHAYSDPHLPNLTPQNIAEEILRTTTAIRDAVGDIPVRYFSPPYNDYNQVVLEVAAELGYRTVLCSLDTADWLRPGVDRIVRRIVPNAHPGAIVLMHPTEQTPAALELIIPGLLSKGYELVTVHELLSP